MALNIRPVDRDQVFLMPPSLLDWLPENHFVFFVLETVGELDLSAFYAAHRADGRGGSVYDPAMMLGVLVYAYCTGERSSRRLERRCIEDVAYRVLTANQFPDHATLARFRRRHQAAISVLFSQVLGLCVRAGLVDTGVVSIDGTKIEANASYFANKSREELAAEILAEAEATDASEDAQLGDNRGGDLSKGWAGGGGRRERIREALNEIDGQRGRDYETRMKERAEKAAVTGKKPRGPEPSQTPARTASAREGNTTDPHSRVIARKASGVMQGYNAQAAATVQNIVLAAEVNSSTNDQPSFVPMTESVSRNLKLAESLTPVGVFVADAGYWTTANGTTDVGADVLIATRNPTWRTKEKPDDDKLIVLAKVNRGELTQRAAGEILGVSHTWVRDMTKRYFGSQGQKVTRNREPEPSEWIPVVQRVNSGEISRRAARDELQVSESRVIAMLAHVRGDAIEPGIARKSMNDKLSEPANRRVYAKRQYSIEPVFGNIKTNLGYRRFAGRGLASVQSEWRLICTAHNLLKLHRAIRG